MPEVYCRAAREARRRARPVAAILLWRFCGAGAVGTLAMHVSRLPNSCGTSAAISAAGLTTTTDDNTDTNTNDKQLKRARQRIGSSACGNFRDSVRHHLGGGLDHLHLARVAKVLLDGLPEGARQGVVVGRVVDASPRARFWLPV